MSQEAIKPVVLVSDGTTSKVAPTEAPKAEVIQSDARLEQLAKRERAFRSQQRQAQQQLSAQKAEIEKLKSAQAPDTSWKDKLKTDFLSVAAEAGLSHDQIAQQLMNRTPESMETKQLRAEITALKSMLEEKFKGVEQTQSKAYDQAIKQVSRDVDVTIHNNEAYELINSKGKLGRDAVVEYIKSTYEDDGILLTAEEASKEVEDYLLEEALSYSKIKKVQAKLAPQDATQQSPALKTQPSQKTVTLTNQATSSTPTRSTASQRRERAILAMQGLLKQ